jgi:phosphinothricin acetyltransferase
MASFMTGGLPRATLAGVSITTATRPSEEADFPTFTAITNEVIRTSATHFGYEPLADDDLATHWRSQRARFPWLTLVDESGAVLGYAKAGSWRARDAYQWTCETTIYLASSARGQGLGRPLYSSLLAECVRLGFHSAVAGITLPNDPSVRLHEALGFVSVGVVQHAGMKFDRWWDVGFWQKLLS